MTELLRKTLTAGDARSRDRIVSVANAVADREQILIPINGMSRATCAGRVEKALSVLPGAQASVNLSTEQAGISFDASRTNPRAFDQAASALNTACGPFLIALKRACAGPVGFRRPCGGDAPGHSRRHSPGPEFERVQACY
jgi:copper chaperone CopZ